MAQWVGSALFHLFLCACACQSAVVELDSGFLQERYNGKWLVKFYAPWCHFCKSMESTWNQVGYHFHGSDLHVGRLDCTTNTDVAEEFTIRGYPTLLFINGDKVIEYEGDRSKAEIIQFANKANGPPVRPISSIGELEDAMQSHDVFFLYVTNHTDVKDSNELNIQYEETANRLQKFLYFFSTTPPLLPDSLYPLANTLPGVLVFKDSRAKWFDADAMNATDLATWIEDEQFPLVAKMSAATFRRLAKGQKKVVIGVLEETLVEGRLAKPSMELLSRITEVANQNRKVYGEHFRFVWTNGNDLVNRLTSSYHVPPTVIAYNPVNEKYNVAPKPASDMTADEMGTFFDRVCFNIEPAYGGNRWYNRIYSYIYQMASFIHRIFSTQPILASILFGLPIGILSVIIVVMCTADFSDEEPEGDEDAHEHVE